MDYFLSLKPYDKFLDQRAILMGLPIGDGDATEIIAKLLFLEQQSATDLITLYINSPGGSVTAGLAIIDTVRTIQPKVRTHCIGQAAGMAAIILASGTLGLRSAAATASVLFCPTIRGETISTENQIVLDRLHNALVKKLSLFTSLPEGQVQQLFLSNEYLTAQEAFNLGVIDHVTER